jgi:hypothetical protein
MGIARLAHTQPRWRREGAALSAASARASPLYQCQDPDPEEEWNPEEETPPEPPAAIF